MRTRKHGLVNTKEYRIWASVRSRCTNPKVVGYKRCGGAGITMCEAWLHSFAAFIADVGFCPIPGYRLERLDRSKGFFKENVVWRKWSGLKTHGLSSSKIYRLWHGMMERCYDKNHVRYHCYGGASVRVQVCKRWHDFASFLKDMGERPEGLTLDRINSAGNYSCGHCEECRTNGWPANARWADQEQQANNKSSSRLITYEGITLTLARWARRLGFEYRVLHHRLSRGWSVARAFTTPLRE